MQNESVNRQKYNLPSRAWKQPAAAFGKMAAAVLVFILCFVMVFSVPASAAEKGQIHHLDTLDYCMRAGNVTVNLSELDGLDNSGRQALVESTSGYAFYKWKLLWREWGDAVTASGDFSGVDWTREGSYIITVNLPSLTPGVVSVISYTLTIIDDLPAEPDPEPEPVSPTFYRITICYLDEKSGLSVKEDYVSEEMEEGSRFMIEEELLLPPEGCELVEILGDTQGIISKDSEILVICRKQEAVPVVPEDPEPVDPEPIDPEPEEPGPEEPGPAEPGPAGPEPGETEGPDPGEQEGQKPEEDSQKADKPSRTAGSGSKTGRGNHSGNHSGSAAAGKSGTSDRTAASEKAPAAAEEAAPAAAEQEEAAPQSEEAQPAEDLPLEEAPEEVKTDTALAEPEKNSDASSLGGAVLPQADQPKEKYPLWSIALGTAEGGVLAVLGAMILSDLKVIRWLEKKKKR